MKPMLFVIVLIAAFDVFGGGLSAAPNDMTYNIRPRVDVSKVSGQPRLRLGVLIDSDQERISSSFTFGGILMFPGSTNVYVLDRVVEQFALSYFSRAYGSPRRVASINENSVEYVVQPRLLEHRHEFERPRTMPLTIVMEFTVYHRGRELFRKTVTSDRFVGDYAWSLTHDNRHHAFENQRYSFVLNSAFQNFVVAFQSTAAETTQLEQASLDSTATSVGSLHKDEPFPANSKPDLPIVTGQSSGPYGTPVDEYGRACISKIHAVAQEQITQPNVFEHNVYATNGCNRVITLKVCYADQRDCTNLTAHPGRESQTTLGIKRGEKEFRYDWSYQNF